jgi:hypothetical protein
MSYSACQIGLECILLVRVMKCSSLGTRLLSTPKTALVALVTRVCRWIHTKPAWLDCILGAGADAAVEAPSFWAEGFTLRVRADGALACPECLAPVAAEVLAAGKAVLLLRSRHGSLDSARCDWLTC